MTPLPVAWKINATHNEGEWTVRVFEEVKGGQPGGEWRMLSMAMDCAHDVAVRRAVEEAFQA